MKRFLLVLMLALALAAQASAVSGAAILPSAQTTVAVVPSLNAVALQNNSSSPPLSTELFAGNILSASGSILNPQLALVLKSGPMAYAISEKNAIVIDTSKREMVSLIKPGVQNGEIDAVAVSPDGNYVYAAVSWAVYQDDYYGGHYDRFARVVRLNASTQQAVDYFQFDGIRPEHLAVSPDGKVYLGFQLAYYPDSAGVKMMDFSQGKGWYIDYKNAFMLQNFEFDSTGRNVYYAGWWDYSGVYRLNWDTNKVHYYQMPGNVSNSYEYVRSIATAKGGKMLYSAVNRNKGIAALNTEDGGMKIIAADYVPVALAASRDGETLYAIGYFYNSDNKPVYLLHKYRGLNVIGPPYGGLFNWLLSTSEAFQFDSLSYINPPSGNYPSNMEVSADGKWGYITTSVGDGASYGYGDGIIVYDLEYMNQVKIIEKEKIGYGIAVSPEKIYHAPDPDFSWANDFAAGTLPGSFNLLDGSLLVKKFYPEKGAFASDYQQEFFVIYAAFTDYLDNATVSNSSFWLTEKSGANVAGKARAASAIAIFSSESQLKGSTDYVAHLSKSIKSKNGKPLYADVEWGFTTRNVSVGTRTLPNSTLNFSLSKGLSIANAWKFAVPSEAENSSKENASKGWMTGIGSALADKLPGSLSGWAEKGAEFGQGETTEPQGGLNGSVNGSVGPGEGIAESGAGAISPPGLDSEERAGTGWESRGIQDGENGTAENLPEQYRYAREGEKCGGFAGPPCETGLTCVSSEDSSDAIGTCQKPQRGILEAIAEFLAGLFGWK